MIPTAISNGVLSGNSLGIPAPGLGQTPSYPWREYSSHTAELQRIANESLVQLGYSPLEVDGVLGPVTCGAAREMCRLLGATEDPWKAMCAAREAPATCQSFTAPMRVGAAPPPVITAPAVSTVAQQGAVGTGTTWLLIGGVLAAAGALAYVGFRAKRSAA